MPEVKKPKAALGIRHVQCVMLFFAILLAYGMRVNMSMAIVAMTDSSMENTFDWNMQIQSVILSSFFWGYVILQVPGGLLADKVGGSLLINISVGANSIISLILPTAAVYGGWYAVCACRVLQGLAQGLIYPSMHNLIGKWVPLEEKSRLGTFIYADDIDMTNRTSTIYLNPVSAYELNKLVKSLKNSKSLVYLDMAPNFAGTMLGITNALANIISIIAPLAAGAIIKDESEATEWRKVFYLSSFIYILGNTIFLIFGTSIRQSWNEPKTEKNIENSTGKDILFLLY
ncbi:putative inorganic phosphate cotransporter [Cydia strobilella]|uniref:putative inorganic phosphate cotransporter n=1 Tax=Cydia strobilella TaxID=1100964 RepID=UPI0030067646